MRRDHLISHILAALPAISGLADAPFIGATFLCRTHLDGLRVSEDVDLLTWDVGEGADSLVRHLAVCCAVNIRVSPWAHQRLSAWTPDTTHCA